MSTLTRTSASLDTRIEIETPEQVAFSYTIAGVGSRAAAALVDAAICVGALAALLLLAGFTARQFGGSLPRDVTTPWITALLVIAQFAIFWGYYVLYEGLSDGQTPGKRRFGLRVVLDGGYSVSFAASAARNILRVVDMQPGIVYGVGIVSVALSRSGKRVGDVVAGTMVVQEQRIALGASAPVATDGSRPRATALLDDAQYNVLERFVARRASLDPARRRAIAAELATRFAQQIGGAPSPPEEALVALAGRERSARELGVASRSDTGAQREQHALVAQGMPRWHAFAGSLARVQKQGLQILRDEEISDFVGRYRALAADLARLRTASRGREAEAVYYLSRLVAGGHNAIYRQQRVVPGAVWRYILMDVPTEFRRSWRLIALAAVLLFGPAVVAFEATRRSPAAAAQLVPRAFVDRVETGVVRQQEGGGYLPDDIARLRGPILSSVITTNNIQVTFLAFAFGITAGVGTVFVLVFNGVAALGAPLGLYARHGIADQILGFVLPHGVLELTAICIGGAAGLHLAAAILLPGAVTRREALVERARRALTLLAGAIVLLLVAGVIEGYISPLVWPLSWKAAVSATTAVTLVLYWGAGHRRGAVGESTDAESAEPVQIAPRPLSSR